MGVKENKIRRQLRRLERERAAYDVPRPAVSINIELPPSTDTGTAPTLSLTAMPVDQLDSDPALIIGERAQRTYKVPVRIGGVIKVRGILTEVH